jgi:hypothetical protein
VESYGASSTYVRGLVKAASDLGLLEPAIARLSGPGLELARDPGRSPWWPPQAFEAFLGALAAQGGDEAVRKVSIAASHGQMVQIAAPLIRVTLAAFGGSPASLLQRIGTFAGVGLKGLKYSWKIHGPTSGTVVIDWPVAVPAYVAATWYGMFDVGFSVSKPGRVTREHVEPQRHTFDLEWEA